MKMLFRWSLDFLPSQQRNSKIQNILKLTSRLLIFMVLFTQGIFNRKTAWKKCKKSMRPKSLVFVPECSATTQTLKTIRKWKCFSQCFLSAWAMSSISLRSKSTAPNVRTSTCQKDRDLPSRQGAEAVKSTLMVLILAPVFPTFSCSIIRARIKTYLKSRKQRKIQAHCSTFQTNLHRLSI
jgi:hypothetical protein